jgi:sRNA-binding protein
MAPDPATFRAFEHPSDDGFTINLEWGRAKSEAANVYYIVEIASEQDYRAGSFRRVARIPSLGKLKADEKRLHNYEDEAANRANQKVHCLGVEPAKFYPADQKSVRDRDYYFRLAMVGTRKTTEKRRKPPEPSPAPPKGKGGKPILLAAKEKSEEFVAQLQSLQETLAKIAKTLAKPDRPTIASVPFLPDLTAIEGESEGVMVLHDECLQELRRLDRALPRGRDALQEEVEAWRRQQAEAQREAEAKQQSTRPQEEYEEVEVETEGEPVFVTEAGVPKVVKARASLPPLVAPEAAQFRAYDLPSDDGSRIAVEWPRTPSENGRTTYAIEMAEVRDGRPGPFKVATEVPSLGAEKSDQPKFFGFAQRHKRFHCAIIQPAEVFPPDKQVVRRQVVEEQTGWMPSSWAPDTDFPGHLAAVMPEVSRYLEGVKRLAARLETLEGPLAQSIEEEDKAFLPALARYRAYGARLQRFEKHVASQNASALTEAKREVNRRSFAFRLRVRRGDETLDVQRDGKPKEVAGTAWPNYFKWHKLNNVIFSVAFCGVVYAFIGLARRNPNLFIRKIAGLEAVEEAIGRATEMGRPVYFVHGLSGMGDLSTIAAVSILWRVARRSAEYDTRVRVMNNDPIVMAVSQEVVKQAYTEAGRPDAYNPDDVALVASDQFSYVAAVGGLMVREQPATIFFMGYFFAESLLLAETGASTGAVQIAGTDSYTQIPFFITACDYTLIGEELYAASAYLSREPRMLGSLRGQDVGKAFLMLIILAGSLALTLGNALGSDWSILQKLFEAF